MDKKMPPDYLNQLFYPHPALRGFIEFYCILTPSQQGMASVPWHIMPDGAAHVLLHVYNTGGSTASRARLAFVGPRSTYIFTDRRRRQLSLIARLRPGSLFLPFSYPVSELKDRSFVLDELLCVDLSHPKEELTQLARTNQITSLVQHFDQLMLHLIANQIKPHTLVQAAIQTIDTSSGQISVRELSTSLGVSDRHLRSVFNKLIGLSPKRYARIVRLTETVRAVERGYSHGWAQLALASGYYDQSHMIDEFQELVGESTEAFIARTNREEILMPASDFSNRC